MTDNLTLLLTQYAKTHDCDLDLFDAIRFTDGDLGAISEWAKRRKLPDRDVRDAVKAWRLFKVLGTRVRTPEHFTEAVIRKLGVSISFDGMISRQTIGLSAEYTLSNLIDDVISANYEHVVGFPESALKIEVSRWVQRSQDSALRVIGASIFDENAPRCEKEWAALARALAMPGAASEEYFAAILQTLIWQVKRKMHGLEISGHLMPILTGVQGNGKSTFLKKFLSPVTEVTTYLSFREAMDSRNLGVWSTYVHVYDEMEKASLTDINSIKSAITGEKRTARVMGTNRTSTVWQRATSIGAMNGRMGEALRDPTGMRRYGPLPTANKPEIGRAGGVDWSVIDQMDYRALWRSVQISDPRPADRVADELTMLQDSERVLDPVEYYLRRHFQMEIIERTTELRGSDAISATDLHRDFSEMMREQFPGHKPVNIQSFGSKVTSYLSEEWCPLSHKEEGKRANFYHPRPVDPIDEDIAKSDILNLMTKIRAAA